MPVRARPGVPYGSVAQSEEHLAVNQAVAGSSPAGIAIAIFRRLCRWDASRRRCTWPAWMHPSVPYVEEGLEVLAWRRVRRRYQAAGNCDIWNSVVIGSRPAWKAGVSSGGLQVRALPVPPS